MYYSHFRMVKSMMILLVSQYTGGNYAFKITGSNSENNSAAGIPSTTW